MPNYRLSQMAKQDLLNIATYGDEHYGVKQSDLFRERLIKRFELLSEQPLLYPAVEHIRAGYRRSVFDRLSIYYRIDPDGITITRILGQQSLEHIATTEH